MVASSPAPGDLEVVRAFVNTRDVDSGTDEFARPSALAEWLHEHGLSGAGDEAPSEPDRELAVTLRESLRSLMLANNDGRSPDPQALADLRAVAASTAIALTVDPWGRLALASPVTGVPGALSRLLLIVERSMADGTWARLKACREDTCQWGFYDHSKNHSRAWCSMDVCGSRNKAREYRRRRSTHDAHEAHDGADARRS
jgi:predicted RNA-binding Zn ribbon-like protein